jgi:glycosyltransferase involved in cell wall biosynthesis
MRIVLFANTDWFLYNFKLPLARALRARGDELILLSPPGEYGPRLRELGFRWEALPVSRSGINPLAELATIARVRRLYATLQPDLVHHFTIKCVIYGSLAARLAGVRRVVNSVTGLGFALLASTLKARLIRPVVLALYRFALRGTAVIFQNPDNRDTLARYGVLARSEVFVVPGDGIDAEQFAPRVPMTALAAEDASPLSRPPATLPRGGGDGNASLSSAVPSPLGEGGPSGPGEGRATHTEDSTIAAADESMRVLMMARLLQSKGVAEFVAAAAQVRQAWPQAEFQLAGSPDPGNPESVDEASLQRWAAEGHVQFLGHRSDVLALNQACSIAVLASTQGEGIPRALLEAAACAKALVATDVPGCRDLVIDGETGLLVPPGDAAALAAAIERLLGDASLRAQLGAAARARVLARYADGPIIEQTLAVYAGGRQ